MRPKTKTAVPIQSVLRVRTRKGPDQGTASRGDEGARPAMAPSAGDLEAEQRQVVARAARGLGGRDDAAADLADVVGRAADQLGELALAHGRAGTSRRRQHLEYAV